MRLLLLCWPIIISKVYILLQLASADAYYISKWNSYTGGCPSVFRAWPDQTNPITQHTHTHGYSAFASYYYVYICWRRRRRDRRLCLIGSDMLCQNAVDGALARSECVYIRRDRPAAANLSQIYSIYKRNVGETYMLCAVGICAIGNSSSVTMTNWISKFPLLFFLTCKLYTRIYIDCSTASVPLPRSSSSNHDDEVIKFPSPSIIKVNLNRRWLNTYISAPI